MNMMDSRKFRRKNKPLQVDPPVEDDLTPIPPLEAREDRLARRASEAAAKAAQAAEQEAAQRRAEIEAARRKSEEEARIQAEEAARLQAEAQHAADQRARFEAEAKARRAARAEAEARAKAEADARHQAEEQARAKAEADARRQAEEQARAKAEADARRQAEEQASAEKQASARRVRSAEARAAARAARIEEARKAEADRLAKQAQAQTVAAQTAPQNTAEAAAEAQKPALPPLPLTPNLRQAPTPERAAAQPDPAQPDTPQANTAWTETHPTAPAPKPIPQPIPATVAPPPVAPEQEPAAPPSRDAWLDIPEMQVDLAHLNRNRVITADRLDPAHTTFDVLRTRLMHALNERGWKRVAITSPGKDCGKTFTAANLAISLSRQENTRTLVMDFDMRRPSLHQVMGNHSPTALGDVLRGTVAPEDHLLRIGPNHFDAGHNIAFALNTVAEPYASELLQDPRTKQALDRIDTAFQPDVMLFDLPPALFYDDVIAFQPMFDGVLLVIGGGLTTEREIKEVERRLGPDTPLLGMVLNKAEGAPVDRYAY